MLLELQQKLNTDIQNSVLPSSALIGNCKLLGTSGSLSDPTYFPFYYHLGKHVNAKTILVTNFYLGLKEVCFLKSCKLTTSISGICQSNSFNELGIKYAKDNIRSVRDCEVSVLGDLSEFFGKIDLIFCDDVSYLKKTIGRLWELLNLEGLLVVDNIYKSEKELESIAFSVNRTPVIFNNRYRVGIIQR